VLLLVAETFEQFADNEYETKTESSMLGMQHIVYRDTRQYPELRVFMQTFFSQLRRPPSSRGCVKPTSGWLMKSRENARFSPNFFH